MGGDRQPNADEELADGEVGEFWLAATTSAAVTGGEPKRRTSRSATYNGSFRNASASYSVLLEPQ